MTRSPDITVVIPTCNRARSLERCLRSIAAQQDPPPFEVIVVDDGSRDHTSRVTARLATELPFPLHYLTQPNRGPASARNLGVRSSAGKTVVFLDDDHQVSPRWLTALCEPLGDPDVGIVNGLNLSLAGGGLASRFLCFTDRRGAATVAADKTRYLTSGNAAMRRAAFEEAGGFSDRFRSVFRYVAPGAEDTELGLRIRRKGYRIVYRPAALTNHFRESSVSRLIKERFNFGRNRVRWMEAEGNPLKMGPTLSRALRLMVSWAFLPAIALRDIRLADSRLDAVLFSLLDKATLTAYQVGSICGLLAARES